MGRGEYWRLVDGQGRPPGLMGMWPSRAITFIENHDTGAPSVKNAADLCDSVYLHATATHWQMHVNAANVTQLVLGLHLLS